ncbi:MAG: hypothetical protein K9K37_06650 [Desulfocapsa sp.]|nr:hypothetical protein [Desulfocapsa sp.]
MQSLNSLYFPETVLPRHLRNCLLLLPDTLHFLQPVEPDRSLTEDTAESDLFTERGISQAHTPSLLGKDRERFMGLILKIRQQKNSIAEQLSALTLAHLSQEQNSGEHNHHAIMASLLDGQIPGNSGPKESSNEAALWQARLVLALAEILDKEEAELAMQLSDIDDDELNLFQELKGQEEGGPDGEENPFAELLRIKAKLSQPRPGSVKRRFQAWTILYGSGALPENFWLWMTGLEEAADLLISKYESWSNRVSVPLLLLNLPEQIYMRDADGLKSIRNFQEKSMDVRQAIIEKLAAIVALDHLDLVDPVALLPDAGILARDWNDLVEYCFPEEKFGRQKLDLQFLANISLDQLFRNESGEEQKDSLCHGIVALCRE